jgi:hypothetical protein
VFQRFDLNLLAAERFAAREKPYVVSAEPSGGAAIVPAVLRHSDGSIRLLGEELFDYRAVLHKGDDAVLPTGCELYAGRGGKVRGSAHTAGPKPAAYGESPR